jgi:DNA-binding transcriptional ArsR family regulator
MKSNALKKSNQDDPIQGVIGTSKSVAPPSKLLHDRTRLAIVSALAVNDSMSFTEMKNLLNTSDGNLSVHARKLEEEGYVKCQKTFEGRKPKTSFMIQPKGKKALIQYLDHMEALIEKVRTP